MSPTGRHVTAAEALKFGLVDQITDHNTVNVAVKFAQRVAGEMWMKGEKKKQMVLTGLLYSLSSLV